MSNKMAPFQSLTHQLNRPGFPPSHNGAAHDRLVSVVISVADEAGNILPLAQEITTVLETLPLFKKDGTKNNYEIIFVDDHSADPTADEIQTAMRRFPNIRLICHQARYGKSQGVWTGLRHARGEWIITMDGDGQNDPADIPRLLSTALESNPYKNILVSGVRVNRAATGSKRIASKFANAVRRALLQDDCPDTGCALKVFRRDAYLALPYFDNIHRYEPTLFKLYGHDVVYIPVNDRQRTHGQSKYTNFKRALDSIMDLFGVMWLQTRYKARNEQSIEIVTIADTTADVPRREHAAR